MGAEQGRAERPLAPQRRGVRSPRGMPALHTRGQGRRHLLVAAVVVRRSGDGAQQSGL